MENNAGSEQNLIDELYKLQEEYALLKEENQRLKNEMKDVYSAGLMCERILRKDQIEKLTAANAELKAVLKKCKAKLWYLPVPDLQNEVDYLLSKHSST